jgi:predicted nucleic acid-binding protein
VSYVVDASVALRWFLIEERHPHADAVLERITAEPESFAVPELFGFEVLSVLTRVHPEPSVALHDGVLPVLSAGILRYPMTPALADRAVKLVPRGLSGYDACYAALAAELDGTWLTFDHRAHGLIADTGLSENLWDRMPADW